MEIIKRAYENKNCGVFIARRFSIILLKHGFFMRDDAIKADQHVASTRQRRNLCPRQFRDLFRPFIATKFNNFFPNIGPSLASKVPSTQFSHKDFLVDHYVDCFFLNPTTLAEVASIQWLLPIL